MKNLKTSSFYSRTEGNKSPPYPKPSTKQLPNTKLFGITVQYGHMLDAINTVLDSLSPKNSQKPSKSLFYINAHCINVARKNSFYHQLLKESNYVFPDGLGVWMAGKLAGVSLPNLNGSDMFLPLCKEIKKRDLRVGVIGATPLVSKQVRKNFSEKFPDLKVVYCTDGFKKDYSKEFSKEVDVLFLAMGVPLQETFYHQNHSHIKAKLTVCIGAQLDFFSRKMKRAPLWMRKLKLEWLFRFFLEPKRMFKRYMIGNFSFVYHMLVLFLSGASRLKNKISL